jgi:hypothetical protein
VLPLAMPPLVGVLAAARATLPAATAALSPVSSLAAVEVASKLLQVPPLLALALGRVPMAVLTAVASLLPLAATVA